MLSPSGMWKTKVRFFWNFQEIISCLRRADYSPQTRTELFFQHRHTPRTLKILRKYTDIYWFFHFFKTCVRSATNILRAPRGIPGPFSHTRECVKIFLLQKFKIRKHIFRLGKLLFQKKYLKKWKKQKNNFFSMKNFPKKKVRIFFLRSKSISDHRTMPENARKWLLHVWSVWNDLFCSNLQFAVSQRTWSVPIKFKCEKNQKTLGNFF